MMGAKPEYQCPSGDGPRGRLAASASTALALLLALSGCSSAPEWANPSTWYDNLVGAEPAPVTAKSESAPLPDAARATSSPQTEALPSTRTSSSSGLAADTQNARYTETTLRANPASAPPPPPPAPPSKSASTASDRVASAPPPPAPPSATDSQEVRAPVPPPPPSATREESTARTTQTAPPPPPLPPADDAPMKTARAMPPLPPVSQSSVPSIVQRPGRDGNAAPVIFPRPKRRQTPPPIVTSPPPPYPSLGSDQPPASNAEADATSVAAAPPSLPPISSATAAPGSDAPPPPIPYGNPTPPPAPLTGGMTTAAAAPALPIAGDQSLLSRVYAQNLAQQAAGNVSQTMTADGTMIISSAAPASFGASAGISGGPALMVLFTHGGSRLGAKSRRDIKALAANLKAYSGYVRIVGHASHRTGNMSQARHVRANFNVSVDRANAVARELLRGGVPSERLIVEAVADTQPRYYETMPGGEAENRRVEIFLE